MFGTSLSALINLFLNLVVVFVFMILNHVGFLATSFWLPLILLEVYILALGLSLLLSAAFVKFRDVSYIWEVFLQAGFYLTPILYSLSIVPPKYQKVLLLNPMSQTIQDARYSVVSHGRLVVTTQRIFNGGGCALHTVYYRSHNTNWGAIYFKLEAKYFAENI